ncbi:hypothetical protein NUW58_g9470 [Xylaria curta]|uniref:Uncharacterized protein n=1 Tax=Xylaria curta TaxID=42375 RepID=A0ACC1MYJ8_9PEZI|nr:hypothetical protein NUW58_g9470 [Xylaria curta]
MATLQQQQVPTPPCWLPDPNTSPHGPESWVVYIVATIAGVHQPLATMLIEQRDIDTIEPASVVKLCQWLARVLSDPSNRTAIASEVNVATDFYINLDYSRQPLPLHEVPAIDQYYDDTNSLLPDDDKMSEFPFLTTCIFMAGAIHTGLTPTSTALGTVFRDENPNFGMVVFDISNLDDLKYGIVAFSSKEIIYLQTLDSWHAWNTMGGDENFGGPRERRVESERPRQAMSARAFMAKFGKRAARPADHQETGILDGLSLVEPPVFQQIWPSEQVPPRVVVQAIERQPGRSLVELATAMLIESTRNTNIFDLSIFDGPRRMPLFRHYLQRALRSDYRRLGHTGSTAQLIALAFEGETHLDLVRYRGQSAKAILAALEMRELEKVKVLSVCVDYLLGSPTEIASVLASCRSLSEIYLLQSARRKSDQLSIDILLELFKHANTNLQVSKVFASGVYSATLHWRNWLPPIFNPPVSLSPIYHIVQRVQTNITGRPRKYWQWNSSDIRGALLSPVRLSTGLLNWLQAPDYRLVRLSSAPPTLQDNSRVEIGPLLAKGNTMLFKDPQSPIREILVSGAKLLLVSREKHWDREVTAFDYVRFAFVEILKESRSPEDAAAPRFERGDFSSQGITEFLEDAMGSKEVDTWLVENRLREVRESLANADGQGRRPDDVEVLDVLSEDEVCDALNGLIRLCF